MDGPSTAAAVGASSDVQWTPKLSKTLKGVVPKAAFNFEARCLCGGRVPTVVSSTAGGGVSGRSYLTGGVAWCAVLRYGCWVCAEGRQDAAVRCVEGAGASEAQRAAALKQSHPRLSAVLLLPRCT